MPRLKSATPGERLLRENPATRSADWLPSDSPWEDLNDLHTRHAALLEDLATAIEKRSALEEKFKKEDEARVQAIQDGEMPPKTTPTDKRTAALDELTIRRNAAHKALAEFVVEAVAEIQEKSGEWLADAKHKVNLGKEQEELAKLALLEARRFVSAAEGVQGWVERSGDPDRKHHHISYDHLTKRSQVGPGDPWARDASDFITREPNERDEQDRLDREKAERDEAAAVAS